MCVVFAWLVAQLIPWSTGTLLVNYKAQIQYVFLFCWIACTHFLLVYTEWLPTVQLKHLCSRYHRTGGCLVAQWPDQGLIPTANILAFF